VEAKARLALQLQAQSLGANYVLVDYQERPHRQMFGLNWVDWPYWVLRGTAFDCLEENTDRGYVDVVEY